MINVIEEPGVAVYCHTAKELVWLSMGAGLSLIHI